ERHAESARRPSHSHACGQLPLLQAQVPEGGARARHGERPIRVAHGDAECAEAALRAGGRAGHDDDHDGGDDDLFHYDFQYDDIDHDDVHLHEHDVHLVHDVDVLHEHDVHEHDVAAVRLRSSAGMQRRMSRGPVVHLDGL